MWGRPVAFRGNAMPFKANAEHRHHIPKQRQRGSLTVWFTDTAIVAWKAELRTTRGGQRRYSELAITTAPTLQAVFSLVLQQIQGLIGSITALLGLDLATPDHTTLSRRAENLDVAQP